MNDGITISTNNNELLIKGTKEDLVELSKYIEKIANSKLDNDHIHLDELSIISEKSKIKNLIVEKEGE